MPVRREEVAKDESGEIISNTNMFVTAIQRKSAGTNLFIRLS